MPAAANFRSRALLLVAALGLIAGTIWLRGPTFGFKVWNVDEAIHAAIARTILDGGVLYRDAVDIRNPLTYYAMAGMFAGFGENNLWAVHCGIAGLIAGTGWLLFLAGRVLRGSATPRPAQRSEASRRSKSNCHRTTARALCLSLIRDRPVMWPLTGRIGSTWLSKFHARRRPSKN